MDINFELKEEKEKEIKIIKIIGELDAMVAPKLKERLEELIEMGERNFVINCQKLTHINSLAMGILRGKLRSVKGKEGKMVLTNLSEHIKVIFEMVGLDEIFEIYNTEEEGIISFE